MQYFDYFRAGGDSSTGTEAPAAPENLAGVYDPATDSIAWTWEEVDGVDGYELLRGTATGAYTHLQRLPNGDLADDQNPSWTQTGAQGTEGVDLTHSAVVLAYVETEGGRVYSAPSAEAQVDTQPAPLLYKLNAAEFAGAVGDDLGHSLTPQVGLAPLVGDDVYHDFLLVEDRRGVRAFEGGIGTTTPTVVDAHAEAPSVSVCLAFKRTESSAFLSASYYPGAYTYLLAVFGTPAGFWEDAGHVDVAGGAGSALISWTDLEVATTLEVATDPFFEHVVARVQGIEESSHEVDFVSESDARLYWRVRQDEPVYNWPPPYYPETPQPFPDAFDYPGAASLVLPAYYNYGGYDYPGYASAPLYSLPNEGTFVVTMTEDEGGGTSSELWVNGRRLATIETPGMIPLDPTYLVLGPGGTLFDTAFDFGYYWLYDFRIYEGDDAGVIAPYVHKLIFGHA